MAVRTFGSIPFGDPIFMHLDFDLRSPFFVSLANNVMITLLIGGHYKSSLGHSYAHLLQLVEFGGCHAR